jgi:predicted acylesterase/phospholipase RssA
MKRALLLGGGNSRGPLAVYPMRQLLALHGAGAYATVIGGSVGALNAALFAEGRLDDLDALYRSVDGKGFYLHLNTRIGGDRRGGIYTLRPLYKRIATTIERKNIRPGLRAGVGVVDLITGEYRNVYADRLSSDTAWAMSIVASCAQPVIMDWWPVEVTKGVEHPCVDGGVRHVIPDLRDWEDYDAIDVIACQDLDAPDRKDKAQVDDLLDVAQRALHIASDQNLRGDVERLKRWAKAGKKVTLYSPPEYPGDPFDASAAMMTWRLDVLGPRTWANGRVL